MIEIVSVTSQAPSCRYQGCESSDFHLMSDFFALHKTHFQTFNALKSTSFQAFKIISDFLKTFSDFFSRSHTPEVGQSFQGPVARWWMNHCDEIAFAPLAGLCTLNFTDTAQLMQHVTHSNVCVPTIWRRADALYCPYHKFLGILYQ